ncbi:F-box domain-containing protein [Mycena kentingensis (nom. inval.)]|nr:F-box domain-containing protein [Mycena kentingensis (nom. inval.)]
MFKLFDLPDELFVQCLVHLSGKDIRACLHTYNSRMNAVIRGSIELEYHLAKNRHQVLQNPARLKREPIQESDQDRLAILSERERRWREFAPQPRSTILYWDLRLEAASHDIAGDLLIQAIYDSTQESRGLSVVDTRLNPGTPPNLEAEASRRTDVKLEFPLMAFGTALEEHGLLVTPRSLELRFLEITTGKPHHDAARPIIHLEIAHQGYTDVPTLDICGDNLVLCFLRSGTHDPIWVLDWRRGVTKTSLYVQRTLDSQSSGMVFITPTLMAFPNPREVALDVYLLVDGEKLEFLHRLHLPGLLPDLTASQYLSTFLPDPATSLIHIVMGLDRASEPEFHVVSLLIDSYKLRQLLLSDAPRLVSDVHAILRTDGSARVADCEYSRGRRRRIRKAGRTDCDLGFQPPPCPGGEGSWSWRDVLREDSWVEAGQCAETIGRFFTEPIWSSLAYVEIESKALFQYSAVELTDTSIIGSQFDYSEEKLASIEILHFG